MPIVEVPVPVVVEKPAVETPTPIVVEVPVVVEVSTPVAEASTPVVEAPPSVVEAPVEKLAPIVNTQVPVEVPASTEIVPVRVPHPYENFMEEAHITAMKLREENEAKVRKVEDHWRNQLLSITNQVCIKIILNLIDKIILTKVVLSFVDFNLISCICIHLSFNLSFIQLYL